MKILKNMIPLAILLFLTTMVSCKKNESKGEVSEPKFKIDSTQFSGFFTKHPEFKEYQSDIKALYKKHQYHYVWYDDGGRNDFAEVLYNKAGQVENEGVPVALPYKAEFDELFSKDRSKPDINNELLISSMYFFYAKKVYAGIDPQQSKQMGWYLPREKSSYVDYLETLLKDEKLLDKNQNEQIGQYYNLRKGLQRYRDIKNKGGWGTIEVGEGVKSLKPGDTGIAVAQLRKRLSLSGELKSDSGSSQYDEALAAAVKVFQAGQHLKQDGIATASMIKALNVPVETRIKNIVVNMERCRWISPDIADSKEYIAVNIPSYHLRYIRDGKIALESGVVVGKELNRTVIFSGKISYLVFSPYWNIPKSIIEKEIKPGIAKDKNYLEKHNMEWNNGSIRQKPGDQNSLGLVKFMFPNSNNIYLHDSPAKSLFGKDQRALSHGCVRVEKARDLAVMILDDDKNWTPAKIDAAMHAGKEKQYTLKRKIPVYLAYFTAWADESGVVSFFEDIYDKDSHLANLLYQ